jgi:hypothetical protein
LWLVPSNASVRVDAVVVVVAMTVNSFCATIKAIRGLDECQSRDQGEFQSYSEKATDELTTDQCSRYNTKSQH